MKKYTGLFLILGVVLNLIPHFAFNLVGLILIILAFVNGNITKKSANTARIILIVGVVISVGCMLLSLLPGTSGVSILGIDVLAGGSIQLVAIVISFVLVTLRLRK